MSTNNFYYSKTKQKDNIPRLSPVCPVNRAGSPQKVLIFGLGLNGGGIGIAKFFSRQGAKVTVTDLKTKEALSASLNELARFPNIKYVLGKHRLVNFLTSDLIVKNPAIPWDDPFLEKARAKGIPITTDTIIFFSHAPALIVGITGTKGKSTTAALLAEILKKKYPKVWLLGNIRESFLGKLSKIKPEDAVVAELSSFQLEDLALIEKSPPIAIITNIFPDHLNRYASLKNYAKAKTNIFLYQKPKDHLIINGNDKFLVKLIKNAKVPLNGAKAKKHFIKNKNLLPLEINIALAAEAAKILGVPKKEITKVVKNFRGLAGRQEIIRTLKNIIFINDTTATNPTAVLTGLEFLAKKYQRPIILIAGGENKNLDYKNLAEKINRQVKKLILLPGSATEKLKKYLKINPVRSLANIKSNNNLPSFIQNRNSIQRSGTEKIFKKFFLSKTSNGVNFSEAKNMEEAVKKAYQTSQTGDIILLSPGAASFNLFQNEFDRGEQFNNCVLKIIS
ncbi:MAG: UDP-N-acetylmuramoyl-L-alanine--D-glutamate ligase [bacterium]|nr:UDP-N-acetylmuramoyl-L-alanine--D-glutamate ligase [bacterium]